MIIMITDRCNLNCPYCLVDTVSREGAHMTDEDFDRSLQLAKLLGEEIVVLAGGEPLLHPAFPAFVDRAVEGGFWLGVTTNGTRLINDPALTHKFAEIRAKNRGQVQITMHTLSWHNPNFRDFWLHHVHESAHPFSTRRKPRALFPSQKARRNCSPERLTGSGYCSQFRHAADDARMMSQDGNTLRRAIRLHSEQASNGCNLHVHRDGTLRAGPSSFCQELGCIDEALGDFERWSDWVVQVLCYALCERCLEGNEPPTTTPPYDYPGPPPPA